MLNNSLGKWNFWTFFVGFNVTFFPMHQLGLRGMTRRIYTYVPETGWGNLNFIASCGAAIIGVSVIMFIVNVLWSRKHGIIAGDNPWGASTLEWATTSPAPSYNFLYLPSVRGRDPLWEHPERAPVIIGVKTHKREVLSTTILEAAPDHLYEMAGDSAFPLPLALTVGVTFAGGIFNPWAFPIGAIFCLVALIPWFWSGTEVKKQRTDRMAKEKSEPGEIAAPLTATGQPI